MSMKKVLMTGVMVLLNVAVLVMLTGTVFAENEGSQAAEIAREARLNSISARGAVQVTQVHTTAHTELMVLIVKQNDEIISLLKELVNKKAPQEVSQNPITKKRR
jgi:cytochrome b